MPKVVLRAVATGNALRDDVRGQTMSEYSVVLAVMALGVVGALLLFSGAIQSAFEVVNDTVSGILT